MPGCWRPWTPPPSPTAPTSGSRPPRNSLPMSERWDGEFVSSIDVRRTPPLRKGRTAAWASSPVDLVAGEPIGPLASYIALVDIANGIAVQQDPTAWMFPNLDLTIHLHRQPEGPWTGLDTTTTFGPSGQGLTSSVLHDLRGPVGHAEQILTVRPLPSD
ncbi:thioesterase family protein [Streptomyces sp. NBC_00984]|nr:thioesterase family protein [Streptomyces sp. NBC_00984]